MIRIPQRSARLSRLLAGLAEVRPTRDRDIGGLTLDSREVRPGWLFLARQGHREHGLAHAGHAVAEGAAAIAWEPSAQVSAADLDWPVPMFEVPELGRRVGEIAARFHEDPSADLTVHGVTGTDGKTSVAHILAEALSAEDRPAGYIGTLGAGLVGSLQPGSHTTPDAVTVQGLLDAFRAEGCRHVAMEVSSHALDQHRVSGVRFRSAVFTNLSRDHLDYHGDLEAYAEAKRRLFQCPDLHTAVINVDDAVGDALAESLRSRVRVLGFSLDAGRAGEDDLLVARKLEFGDRGLVMEVVTPAGEGRLQSRLLGAFNAANLLAALGVLLGEGMALDEALERLSRVHVIPGRMEPYGGGERPLVIVDFAHTPAALEHVLSAARAHCRGKLWVVFGCGGDRDPGKRPLMGAVAEQLADRVVLTSDNPRSEDPAAIAEEVLRGITRPDHVRIELDRIHAIDLAVAGAEPGDVVVIAGKGHEEVQLIGNRRIRHSDREQVLRHLEEVMP